MRRGKTFRSRFDMGLYQVKSAVKDQAEGLQELEKKVERSMREHPMVYAYAGAALLLMGIGGLLLALKRRKKMMKYEEAPRPATCFIIRFIIHRGAGAST